MNDKMIEKFNSLNELLLQLDFELIEELIYELKKNKIILIITKNKTFPTINTIANDSRMIYIEDTVNKNKLAIIYSRLNSIIGNNKTIFARKTILKRIGKSEAQPFLETNHLLGYASVYYKFGLYFQNNLVAVALFSKARELKNENPPIKSHELVRYASILHINIVGGISKLLHHFIEMNQVKHLMTYTDKTWGETNSYKKLGFEKTEEITKNNLKHPFVYEKWILKK